MNFRHTDHLSCRFCQSKILSRPSKRPGPLPPHSLPWAKPQYRKERSVLPTHQVLDLRVDIEKKTLTGKTSIEVYAIQDGVSHFALEAVDLLIESVKVGGKNVTFRTEADQLFVHLPQLLNKNDRDTVEVQYSTQSPRAGVYFNAPDSAFPNRPIQVFTQGQDDDARFWFPCFDEPGIKFTFEMKVEAPEGYICTSNGALVSENRSGDWWQFHWKMNQPLPAYLVTLTAGRFAEIRESWKGKPVHYLGEKGLEKELQLACGKTPDMLDHFSQLLGLSYPYEKYHQIVISDFTFGGMENTTATTLTDLTLHPPELENNYSSVDLVAHELAHQWFGDWVTCKTWSHGWLNESWATFMEYVYKEKDKGADETAYYRYEDLKIYLEEDSRNYRRPIVTNVYSDPAEIWDRHLYQKGGLVLNMLRSELGEDTFWRATKLYLERHGESTVETVDFQRALEEVSQRPLDWFFDQWLYKAGHPELKISFEWNEDQKFGSIQIEQKQKTDFLTPVHRLRSHFEVFHANGERQIIPFEMKDATKTVVFPAISKPLAIRFDTSNALLKTLEWALPEEMIFEQLQIAGDVVGKVWALKALAKKPSRRAEEALSQRLEQDSFWALRAEAAAALGEVRTSRAQSCLIESLKKEKDSRVRAAIAKALGQWRSEESFEALKSAVSSEQNVFAKAAAIHAMGQTRSSRAFDEIMKHHQENSWGDLIKKSVYSGIKETADKRAADVLVKATEYGESKLARGTAVLCLGEIAKEREDIDHLLVGLLKDSQFPIPRMAASAIEMRGKPELAGALDKAGYSAVEGHFKFMCHLFAQRLRSGTRASNEISALQDDFNKLRDENQKLKEKIDTLEQRYASSTNNNR